MLVFTQVENGKFYCVEFERKPAPRFVRSANSFTAINIINNSRTSVGLYVIRESNVQYQRYKYKICVSQAIHICHISYM